MKLELELLTRYTRTYGDPRNQSGQDGFRIPPCWPFIETCLLAGARFNPETGENIGIINRVDDWSWSYGTLQITFDITNLLKPRYCIYEYRFVNYQFDHCRYQQHFRVWPLSDYIDEYKISFSPTMQVASEYCKSFELIDHLMIRKIAPFSNVPVTFEGLQPSEQKVQQVAIPTGPPTLMELSVKTFVNSILGGEQCADELLDPFVKSINNRRCLRKYLEENVTDMEDSPVTGYLLKAAFAETKHINLVPWTYLSVRTIVHILQWDPVSSHVEVLSIPSKITHSRACKLAKALPARGIKELYVFSGPEDENMTDSSVYWDPSLSSKVKGRIIIDSMFKRSLWGRVWLKEYKGIPFRATDCPVLQIIYQNRGHADVTPLADAMLSPVRLVSGLFNLLRLWLRIPQSSKFREYNFTAVNAFASAPSSLEDPSQIEVSCLPSEAYKQANQCETREWNWKIRSKIRDLDQGTWTVIIVLDQPQIPSPQPSAPTFKIGFVQSVRNIEASAESATMFRPEDIDVLNIEGFLRATAPDAKTESLEILERSLNQLRKEMYDIEEKEHQFVKGSLVKNLTIDEAYALVKRALLWGHESESDGENQILAYI